MPGSPVPTPASTASPRDPTICPTSPDACAFAAQVNRAVLARDVDAVVAKSQPYEFCPEPGAGQLGYPPLCHENSTRAKRFVGYLWGHLYSEGSALTEQQYRESLQTVLRGADTPQSDEYGPGSVRLYTLGCMEAPANDKLGCENQFEMMFSASGYVPNLKESRRGVLIFVAQRSPETGAFRIVSISGGSLPPNDLSIALRGGSGPPGTFVYGTFFRWQPPSDVP